MIGDESVVEAVDGQEVTVVCEHSRVEPGDRLCNECGQSITFAQNVKAHVKARARANWLDLKRSVSEIGTSRIECKVCGEGRMFRKTVYRAGPGVVFVGVIIRFLSVIGFLAGLAGCVTLVGAPVGASLIGGSIFWFLIGLLLTMKKKVLQCSNRKCRATVAAS